MEQLSFADAIVDHRHDLSDAHSVDSAFSNDSGGMTIQEAFEHDISSIRTEKLYNELQRVKDELKSKDGEVLRAHEMRDNINKEVEDLTISLFQSAHSMVEEAKYAQADAEQKLKTAYEIIDALTLENSQLKKTVVELKQILNSCRSSSSMSIATTITTTTTTMENNIDNILFREFECWQDNPLFEQDASVFMYRIYSEDILPCLAFPNADLSRKILAAIENNDIVMELYDSKGNMKTCSLMGEYFQCNYRVRLDENSQWWSLSQFARNRIVAVCEFFTFIRHMQSGLVKSDAQSRFNKIIELRKQMAFARLGL